MLPGPVTRLTGSQTAGETPSTPVSSTAVSSTVVSSTVVSSTVVSSNPYAKAATAWAPPTAYTSSTPSSAQAARIVGCGYPAKTPVFSRWGGEATASEPTPAIWAGTTFMTTLEGYTARPPGT